MRTMLIWFVNSARSSSLRVWLTLALDPCMVTFPAFVFIEVESCDRNLTFSCGNVSRTYRWRCLRPTSTQSSNSTLPLASTLTCFNVSRATSYDWPVDWIDCRTVDLSTLPGVSVCKELWIGFRNHQAIEITKRAHLKRLMRSNIWSRETSGYFFCSLRASIVMWVEQVFVSSYKTDVAVRLMSCFLLRRSDEVTQYRFHKLSAWRRLKKDPLPLITYITRTRTG